MCLQLYMYLRETNTCNMPSHISTSQYVLTELTGLHAVFSLGLGLVLLFGTAVLKDDPFV